MKRKENGMAWYETASVYWPWLVSKEISIVQFQEQLDDGGHNQFAAKLTFKFLGFKVGKEFLLIVNHQSPSWGLDWIEYKLGGTPEWRCMHYKEQVEAAVEKWFDMIERNKELQRKDKARELDRGTVVSKYSR